MVIVPFASVFAVEISDAVISPFASIVHLSILKVAPFNTLSISFSSCFVSLKFTTDEAPIVPLTL